MKKNRFLLPLLALALVPVAAPAQSPTRRGREGLRREGRRAKLLTASIGAERGELGRGELHHRGHRARSPPRRTSAGWSSPPVSPRRRPASTASPSTPTSPASSRSSSSPSSSPPPRTRRRARSWPASPPGWRPPTAAASGRLPGGSRLDLEEISRRMATSRDPKELAALWAGWHAIAPPLRKDYARYVELGNAGAKELGFADMGAMWRSKYDMPPDAYAKELDRLWEQVKPLYVSLHAYVRMQLRETYGKDVVPEKGPIPAHLLGNMWAQQWGNIYPLLAPKDADPGYDLTKILVERKTDARQMVRYGEGFFTSLGFAPLPEDVLGALALHTPARPRGRLPRERLVHRLGRRPPAEDVHRHQRGGLRHGPPRARAQLLPARLQPPARPLPRQRQRRLPRGDRRHHRPLAHARLPRQARPPREDAASPARTSATSSTWRSTRSPSCRSASSSTSGAGRPSRARSPRRAGTRRGGT